MMTEQQARELAAKRESHKSKHLRHKTWTAIHSSDKGWHVALVESASFAAQRHEKAHAKAVRALALGDLNGFLDAASESLLAKCQATIARGK